MSAIVIGLGSTGLHIVEHLQQFHYQFTDRNKSAKVEYMFCETDLRVVANGTAGGNDILSVPLPLTNMAAHIPALKQQQISNEWIPDANTALAAGHGAGGQSAYGRLALWMNWNNVHSAINNAWINVNGNNQTNIFIVGSLTGGTCTGTFIDVAYLCRHITGSNNIFGMFLIPGNNHVGIVGGNNVLENYLIAIATLAEFSKASGNIVYDNTWVGGFHYKTPIPPFSHTFLLSTDYANNNANISNINDLCKVAALNLCCRVMDMVDANGNELQNFQNMYDASIMNAAVTALPDLKFVTFGTTLIHYPKSQLTEWFALDLCQEVLSRWVNPEYYFDKTNIQQSVLGNINRINHNFNKEFEVELQKALNIIDGMPTVGANTIEEAIANDVTKMKNENNFSIFNAFTSNRHDNYYGFVSNNAQSIKNTLIDSIYQLIEKYMQNFQNLFVIKNIFESNQNNQLTLQSHIQIILNFWENKYGIDGIPANFNKVLQKKISEINAGKVLPSALMQSDKYYQEQLTNLFTLCKLHFAVSILKDIVAAINAQQSQNFVLRGYNYTLPSINQIKSIIEKVQSVIQLPQGQTGKDIISRKTELDAEMTTSTHFKALFNESRDADKLQIRNQYNNMPTANKFSSMNLCGVNVYDYLVNSNNNISKIYRDCVVKGVSFVRNAQLIGVVGISGLLHSLSGRNPIDRQYVDICHFFNQTEHNIVPTHIPGLLGLRNNAQPAVQFQSHAKIKLMYASENIANLRNAIQNRPNLNNDYLSSLTPAEQNCIDMPSLHNALVVYQEYGFMVSGKVLNPITDIAINSAIKTVVDNIPVNNHKVRCPYIDWDTLQTHLNTIPT